MNHTTSRFKIHFHKFISLYFLLASTARSLPTQCSSYFTSTDGTRRVTYGVGSVSCDSASIFGSSPAWVRFSGAAGTQLLNYSTTNNNCNTHASGWYRGRYPDPGNTVVGIVCYNWNGNTCNWSNNIQVTNCNNFYVYQLSTPPACSLRYCTM